MYVFPHSLRWALCVGSHPKLVWCWVLVLSPITETRRCVSRLAVCSLIASLVKTGTVKLNTLQYSCLRAPTFFVHLPLGAAGKYVTINMKALFQYKNGEEKQSEVAVGLPRRTWGCCWLKADGEPAVCPGGPESCSVLQHEAGCMCVERKGSHLSSRLGNDKLFLILHCLTGVMK